VPASTFRKRLLLCARKSMYCSESPSKTRSRPSKTRSRLMPFRKRLPLCARKSMYCSESPSKTRSRPSKTRSRWMPGSVSTNKIFLLSKSRKTPLHKRWSVTYLLFNKSMTPFSKKTMTLSNRTRCYKANWRCCNSS